MDNEKLSKISIEVAGVFTLIQRLEMPVNENNIAIMNSSLSSLKWVHEQIEGELQKPEEKEEEKNGNADPE